MAGINKYIGPWTKEIAKHLVNRTMFGATQEDVEYLF